MVRGSNPGGSEIFRTCTDRPWGPPSLLYNGYRVFPGAKERPRRDADPSPPSSAVVIKGYSYTSTPPMGRTACTEPQCLYKGDLYLFISLFNGLRTLNLHLGCIRNTKPTLHSTNNFVCSITFFSSNSPFVWNCTNRNYSVLERTSTNLQSCEIYSDKCIVKR